MHRSIAGLGPLLLASCAGPMRGPRPVVWESARWQTVVARDGVSLRGLAVVDAQTLFVGGSAGTLLRSRDGGHGWQDIAPPDAAALDFRAVHAFSAESLVAVVAGQPARIYHTDDGGAHWTIAYADPRPAAFFDAVGFAGDVGYVLGDPIDGAFTVLRSDDRGRTFRALPPASLPAPIGAEAAFAASNTCLAAEAGRVSFVTGGAVARWCSSVDGGRSWRTVNLPLAHGKASQGAFALAHQEHELIVVGGDYADPDARDGCAAWSGDEGASFAAVTGVAGYRSGVAFVGTDLVIAVGERGADGSEDGGRTWHRFGSEGFHTVARGADGAVFACGSGGRVARLELER